MSNPVWNDFYFNWEEIKEVSRMFTVLWNTYAFVKTYAPKKPARAPELMVEDRWIISRLNSLIGKKSDAEGFEMHKLVQGLRDFILSDFSRWYIKIIRDRVSPWYEGQDKAAAEYTLNYVLENLVRMLAPVTPLIAEKIHLDMHGRDSVHMEKWPRADSGLIDKKIEEEMAVVENMIENMNALRQEKGIKLRWPVREAVILPSEGNREKLESVVKNLGEVIKGMGNAKEIRLTKKDVASGKEFSMGRVGLGEVLQDEALLRELVRNVQVARKENGLMVHDRIKAHFDSDAKTLETLKRLKSELMAGVGSEAVNFGKFEGEAKGALDFEGAKIRFGFRKAA
jgi:isoleucyl-tRNA synthetase